MDIASVKTHIIFDFDRTIATINVNWANWHLGAGEIFKKYGADLKSEIDKFTREFEAKEVKGIEPILKTIELIKDLHRKGKCLYIWSSNDSVLVEKSLKELDIYHKLSFLVTRDNVDLLKPETSGFDKHFANLDKNLDKFLMVGDSESDSLAAKSCNIDYLDVLKIK